MNFQVDDAVIKQYANEVLKTAIEKKIASLVNGWNFEEYINKKITPHMDEHIDTIIREALSNKEDIKATVITKLSSSLTRKMNKLMKEAESEVDPQ